MVKIEGHKASHDNECEKKIFDKYKAIINKGKCTNCEAKNNSNVLNRKLPTSLFVVGKYFRAQNPRILFVGKTLRGGWEENEQEGTDAIIIRDNNGEEIIIDITQDDHEERSFKGYNHIDDFLMKCFSYKKYKSKKIIDRFFEKKPYPKKEISDICTILNDEEFKQNGKKYDEETTIKFLEKLNADGSIEADLFKDKECKIRKEKGSVHHLSKSVNYILERVYDTDDVDELWRRAAITNAVKCSVSELYDKTHPDMIENCINAGFIKSEIEIIQPTHIVFYTAEGNYIDYIEKLKIKNFTSEQINEKPKKIGVHTRKEIGDKAVMWWYKIFFDKKNNVRMHMLVTRHPQGARNKWKEEIVEWIKYTHENIHKKSDIKLLKAKYK